MPSMWSIDSFYNLASATYVVIDDVHIDTSNRDRELMWKGLLGCQDCFNATDKYRKKQLVKLNYRPVIFLCNPDSDPLRICSPSFVSWLRGEPGRENIIYVELEQPLY